MTYEDLVRRGVELIRYQERPTPDQITGEATKLAVEATKADEPIYGMDAAATVARQRQETSKNVIERFQQAVEDENTAVLQGTLWEVWEVEDCKILLATMEEIKAQIILENTALKLREESYEERTRELEEWSYGNIYKEGIENFLPKLKALVSVLEKITTEGEPSGHLRRLYAGWSEEQIQQYYDRAKELVDELEDKLEDAPGEDDGYYDDGYDDW